MNNEKELQRVFRPGDRVRIGRDQYILARLGPRLLDFIRLSDGERYAGGVIYPNGYMTLEDIEKNIGDESFEALDKGPGHN